MNQVKLRSLGSVALAVGILILATLGLTRLSDEASTLAFAVSAVVVGLLDIHVDGRRSLAFDGPIVAAAFILVGPLAGLATGIAGRGASFVRSPQEWRSGVRLLASRLLVLCLGLLLVTALPSVARLLAASPLVAAALLSALFELADFALVLGARAHGGRTIQPLSSTAIGADDTLPLAGSLISAAMLACAVVPGTHAWGLGLTVLLIVLIRQSYQMLLEMRGAYRTTIAVLVEAAEEGGEVNAGHAERSAGIARAIGLALGIRGPALEQLTYAALLKDIDLLAADDTKKPRQSGMVVRDVAMMGEASRALALLDDVRQGDRPSEDSDSVFEAAFIVSLASDIDALENPGVIRDAQVDWKTTTALAAGVPVDTRAKAVAAAVKLGLPIPAIG